MQPELEEAPLVLDTRTWTRILLQARRLPPNMSEGAIARWVISQSYMLIPLDLTSLCASLHDAGVVRFRADGHVEYQLSAKAQPSPHALWDRGCDSAELDSGHLGAVWHGQYFRQPGRKRARPRPTAPLLSPATIKSLDNADNSFVARAVLRGHSRPWSKSEQITSAARRRSSSGSDTSKDSSGSSHDWKEDDPRIGRLRAALADAKARQTRQAERRAALFEKRGFFFSQS